MHLDDINFVQRQLDLTEMIVLLRFRCFLLCTDFPDLQRSENKQKKETNRKKIEGKTKNINFLCIHFAYCCENKIQKRKAKQ